MVYHSASIEYQREVQPLNIIATHYNGLSFFFFLFSRHLNDVEWPTIQQVLNIKEKYSHWTSLLHTTVGGFLKNFSSHLNDVEWFTLQVMKKNTSKFSIWFTAPPKKTLHLHSWHVLIEPAIPTFLLPNWPQKRHILFPQSECTVLHTGTTAQQACRQLQREIKF